MFVYIMQSLAYPCIAYNAINFFCLFKRVSDVFSLSLNLKVARLLWKKL